MNNNLPKKINLPLKREEVITLHCGDSLVLSGVLLTGRDAAHKWLNDSFIENAKRPTPEDQQIHEELLMLLRDGAIYHCGPVVKQVGEKFHFVAAGPTTSIREEGYEAEVIRHFGLRMIIGKGGMGATTLRACHENAAVYCALTGGAAALAADCVKEVIRIFKPEFGVPEAMWLIRVEDLPVVVSMDAHGCSLHDQVRSTSRQALDTLINRSN